MDRHNYRPEVYTTDFQLDVLYKLIRSCYILCHKQLSQTGNLSWVCPASRPMAAGPDNPELDKQERMDGWIFNLVRRQPQLCSLSKTASLFPTTVQISVTVGVVGLDSIIIPTIGLHSEITGKVWPRLKSSFVCLFESSGNHVFTV